MTDVVKNDVDKDDLRKAEAEKEQLAASPITGGNVRITQFHVSGPGGGEAGVSHEYIGVGPLLVPCTRGEQKAISGDVLVEIIKQDETDPTKENIFYFLLPKEVAEVIKSELATDPPVTRETYQKFQDDREGRKHPANPIVDGKPVRPSHPIATPPPSRPSPKPTV